MCGEGLRGGMIGPCGGANGRGEHDVCGDGARCGRLMIGPLWFIISPARTKGDKQSIRRQGIVLPKHLVTKQFQPFFSSQVPTGNNRCSEISQSLMCNIQALPLNSIQIINRHECGF
jgi:hypothetical protein